ncbi:formyl peptide receptor-related sequence 3-like [Eleutherodactylus coqui]|uniref:formyl peptide receptor-related sequence 3-like n=1 Tax=Eleutherodactylus coqui TaxID=57060 RepID=UPI003462272D
MENTSFPLYDYTTYNYIDEDEESIDPNIFRIFKIVNIIFDSITFILGTTGNGLVIWIAGFKMQKTVSVLWFLNLAIADFVFDISFPLQITEFIMDGHWPFGNTMCKVLYTILFINMSVSTSFLMIISVDRCTAIMCPVWSKNHKSPKLATTISAIIWTTCLMLSFPYFAFFEIVHDEDNETGISYCIPAYADDDKETMRYQTMIIFGLTSMFLVPFSIIVICYSLIIFRMRRSSSLSKSNRPLKVIVTIMLCFFSSWFPFYIWPLLEIMNVELDSTVDFIMSQLVYTIGFFDSCVNPMVYIFVGRDFKKTCFKSIPFLLENTLKEKDVSDTEPRFEETMMETEMEGYE